MWTNAQVIEQFRKDHPHRINEGATLLLPDVDQWFEVVGHVFWKKKGWSSLASGWCGAVSASSARRSMSLIPIASLIT